MFQKQGQPLAISAELLGRLQTWLPSSMSLAAAVSESAILTRTTSLLPSSFSRDAHFPHSLCAVE